MLYIVPVPSISLLQGTAYKVLLLLQSYTAGCRDFGCIHLWCPNSTEHTYPNAQKFLDANITEDWDQKSVPMETVNNHHLNI